MPVEPLLDRSGGDAELISDLRDEATCRMAGNHQLSTMNRHTGIQMWVVHPSGSSAGVWPLRPNPEPGEQPPETSHLARLCTAFDQATGVLSIEPPVQTARFDIANEAGQRDASRFLGALPRLPDEQVPQLYEGSPHRFTDVSVVSSALMNAISLINHASITALSDAVGPEIDPGRFRGNIQFAGLPVSRELEMIGQEAAIGSVRLKIVMHTKRCPATEVHLERGATRSADPQAASSELWPFGHGRLRRGHPKRRDHLGRPYNTPIGRRQPR